MDVVLMFSAAVILFFSGLLIGSSEQEAIISESCYKTGEFIADGYVHSCEVLRLEKEGRLK